MAASSQDKLMEVGIATATTLDANYTINDTSITVASTSGWPTATGVAFAIDVVDSNGVQVPGTYNEYVGVVSSATSITSVDHVNGTDRNYSAGATTRVYIPVSAERENRIVDWGTVQHNQDGTHAAVTATSVATDTISESTPANGVTIDGLNIKDSKLVTANSVVTANITNDAVTYVKLLSTIFSGQITTDTNPGTAGGTRNKLNLGGVKLSWGKTGAYSIGAGGAAIGTITFPTSHFTTAPTVFYSLTELTTSGRQYPYESAATSTTTSAPAVINETGGTVGGKLNWIAIGV